jgi:predicted O-methyltransferase YrrM
MYLEMSLDQYLKDNCGVTVFGYILPEQKISFLKNLLCNNPKKILEIGFNGGHSSDFLLSNTGATVTSFELGVNNPVVYTGKEYIDLTHPGRHTILYGNSCLTVPTFAQTYPDIFDILFIDGGHKYEVAKQDLANCKSLADKNTIVIMDDTNYIPENIAEWSEGPTRAWKEAVASGEVIELGHDEYSAGRGMSWGKYVFSK